MILDFVKCIERYNKSISLMSAALIGYVIYNEVKIHSMKKEIQEIKNRKGE